MAAQDLGQAARVPLPRRARGRQAPGAALTAAVARRAKQHAARANPLAVFTARCEARALLWQAGEIDLHDAVDALQAAAVRDGLIAELGQEEVQRLMAEAIAPVREDRLKVEPISDDTWSAPSWHEAAVEYHKDRGNRVSRRRRTQA